MKMICKSMKAISKYDCVVDVSCDRALCAFALWRFGFGAWVVLATWGGNVLPWILILIAVRVRWHLDYLSGTRDPQFPGAGRQSTRAARGGRGAGRHALMDEMVPTLLRSGPGSRHVGVGARVVSCTCGRDSCGRRVDPTFARVCLRG